MLVYHMHKTGTLQEWEIQEKHIQAYTMDGLFGIPRARWRWGGDVLGKERALPKKIIHVL